MGIGGRYGVMLRSVDILKTIRAKTWCLLIAIRNAVRIDIRNSEACHNVSFSTFIGRRSGCIQLAWRKWPPGRQ
jgi:hypothetical protein